MEQLRFSPVHTDELVSVSSDKTVKFWDVRQKKEAIDTGTEGENINAARVAEREDGVRRG